MKKIFIISNVILICIFFHYANTFASVVKVKSEKMTYLFSPEQPDNSLTKKKHIQTIPSKIIKADIPFSDIGMHVKTNSIRKHFDIEIQIKTSKNGQNWTQWNQLQFEMNSPHTNFYISDLIGIDQKDRTHRYYQYQILYTNVTDNNHQKIKQFSFILIDSGKTPKHLLDLIHHQKNNYQQLRIKRSGNYPKPPVISRSGWGADESIMTWTPQYKTISHIIIHHTVTPNTDNDWAARVRSIYYYHAVSNGWGDIGYNFLVDPEGLLYEGRSGGDNVIGAHAYGYNSGSMGFSFIGTYTSHAPSESMINAAEKLMAWKCDQNDIDPTGSGSGNFNAAHFYISGHRDLASTACPGDSLYEMLPDIRMNVKNRINGKVLSVYDFWRSQEPYYADPNSTIWNPNFDAQYKIKNEGSQSIFIEKLALAIHDSNNNHLWDMANPDTGQARYYYNIELNSDQMHQFDLSVCYFQLSGSYKLVAKAKINNTWEPLASQDFFVNPSVSSTTTSSTTTSTTSSSTTSTSSTSTTSSTSSTSTSTTSTTSTTSIPTTTSTSTTSTTSTTSIPTTTSTSTTSTTSTTSIPTTTSTSTTSTTTSTTSTTISTTTIPPEKLVNIDIGWNLIHLPQVPEQSFTSETLIQKIENEGGDISKIQKWDGSGWKTYASGAPFGMFDIIIGEGYFILANKESLFSYSGQTSVCNEYIINSGWNLFGFPSGGPFNSFSLAEKINDNNGNIVKIQKWDGSGWFTYAIGAPFGFFDIQTNAGYFLLSETQSDFDICLFKISNVRDTQFSVSWISEFSEEGLVYYGTDTSLGFTNYDDRGQVSSTIHHITVKSLQPDTLYYFAVLSGSTLFNNNGKHFTIKTGPGIIPSGSILPAGKVMKSDGQTPVSDALIYMTLKDVDGNGSTGKSSLESVMTDSSGFWYAELVNFRTKNYQNLFDFTENVDIVLIRVNAGVHGNAYIENVAFDSCGGTMLFPVIKLRE